MFPLWILSPLCPFVGNSLRFVPPLEIVEAILDTQLEGSLGLLLVVFPHEFSLCIYSLSTAGFSTPNSLVYVSGEGLLNILVKETLIQRSVFGILPRHLSF